MSGYGNIGLQNNPTPPADTEPLLSEADAADLIFDELAAEPPHWLADAIAYAMESCDAPYLLRKCERHLRPLLDAEEKSKREWLEDAS